MAVLPVTIAVEGIVDEAVAGRILRHVGLQPGPPHITAGKNRLDRQLAGFNAAAHYAPWLVLRDLDHDADCAASLCADLLPEPATTMCFRVAVRSIESWLLADRAGIARFLSVGATRVPRDPDACPNPKLDIVALARASRSRRVREDIPPPPGLSSSVGPGYTPAMIEFATRQWDPAAAAERSDSLARCLRRVAAAFTDGR